MTDEASRDLERRFHETRAPVDEAAWIAARVRAGELTWTQVEVAALCEHDGARATGAGPRGMTLEECAEVFRVRPATVKGWVRRGCPARGTGSALELDLGPVLRWQQVQRWPLRRRRDAFLRALARVDPLASECFAGAWVGLPAGSSPGLRQGLAEWSLRYPAPLDLLEPLRLDPRPAVTEWLLRQVEARHPQADAAANCLLRRDQPVDRARLDALGRPRSRAVERMVRFLSRSCACARGFKADSPRALRELADLGEVELLEEWDVPFLHSGDWEYDYYERYRCVRCGSEWLARQGPYEQSVRPEEPEPGP